MALKVLDSSGTGNISAAADALYYAVAHGAKISNNSYGYQGQPTQSMADAIAAARTAGDVFVAAAGNNETNDDQLTFYPADYSETYDNVVNVAATDSSDHLAYFSNYGAASVQIAAPGVNILSTVPGGGYASLSGTSMASPVVAGTIALLESAYPHESYSEWIARLLRGADPVPGLSGIVAVSGRVDVYRALTLSGPGFDGLGPKVLSATPGLPTASPVSSVRLTFDEPIDPTSFTLAQVTGFAGPGGVIAVQSVVVVPGTNNTEFDVNFPTQSVPGSYTFTVGGIRDQLGQAMDQDGDGSSGGSAADGYTADFTIVTPFTQTLSDSTVAPIPGGGTLTQTLTVSQSEMVIGLSVGLSINQTWDSDLIIRLVGPNGRAVVLANRRGGAGSNFTASTFDDSATLSVARGTAPFSGTFQPEGALATFDGLNAEGTWQLQVQDAASGNPGELLSWSLRLQLAPGAAPPASSGGSSQVVVGSLSSVPTTTGLSLADAGQPVFVEGQDSTCYGTSVSEGGLFVAFCSSSSDFVPNDSNGCDDVFVRDTANGTTCARAPPPTAPNPMATRSTRRSAATAAMSPSLVSRRTSSGAEPARG